MVGPLAWASDALQCGQNHLFCMELACGLLADRMEVHGQVMEAREEALNVELRIKEQLCSELNLLVQQSAHAQVCTGPAS